MSEGNEKGQWHNALMKWLTGAIYASVKTMGARQAKVMSRGMALVFVRSLTNELHAKKGAVMQPTDDPLEALEQYREAELLAGLSGPDQVSFVPGADGQVEIAFRACPYGPLCSETLAGLLSRGDFNKASVPCIRMDTYSAAVAVLQNSKRPYRLVQFAPGARCQGALAPPRTVAR